jgi:sarcosine oxidase subunit beta
MCPYRAAGYIGCWRNSKTAVQTTEILVIGAGVIGNSIAYHLARQGRWVLVVDRADIATEPSASWASAGGIRRQGRHAAEVQLAIESIARWPMLGAELDADLHYDNGGNLLLAENDSEAERLARFVRAQHKKGFTDVRLVDRIEVRQVLPGVGAQVVAGSYSPADGQANSASTTRAFAAAAQRHGATYLLRTECDAILARESRVIGARTPRGDVEAETVILAAGALSNRIAATVGLKFPIHVEALQMIRSTGAPTGSLVPVVSAIRRTLSLKQSRDGTFLLGGGWPGDIIEDGHGYRLRPASLEGNWNEACAILPAVATQRVQHAWCGLEAMSADNIPFVGALREMLSLIVATGFSGHGFAIAPAIGRALADQLAGKPVPELDGLRPDRTVSESVTTE